jgi:hypothetical protein
MLFGEKMMWCQDYFKYIYICIYIYIYVYIYILTDRCTSKGPQNCPEVFSPVCGSDGKTYNNACLFALAQCYNQNLLTARCGVANVNVIGKFPCIWGPTKSQCSISIQQQNLNKCNT